MQVYHSLGNILWPCLDNQYIYPGSSDLYECQIFLAPHKLLAKFHACLLEWSQKARWSLKCPAIRIWISLERWEILPCGLERGWDMD